MKLISANTDDVLIRIIVEDTGIGIAADKTELIFDTFTQADGSTTRQYGGTGLGLSISRRLARLLGGDLRVESELGRGASFLFDVPVKLDVQSAEETVNAKMSPYKNVGVLYIAPQQPSSHLVQTLKDLSFKPQIFDDPAEAVVCKERLDKSGVAIVDSMVTAQAARRIQALKTVPLVLLTNDSERLDISRCLELGITSYGSLPASQSSIANALLPALEIRGASPSYETSNRYKILLAEDNVINQRVAVKLLEKFKHTIEVCENGLMAVEAIQAGRKYDLILMDLQMPVCGGIEATQRIRQWEATTHSPTRLPIIALTAKAMRDDREKCLEAGMDDVVTKPIKMDTLVQTINKCATLGNLVPQNLVSSSDPVLMTPVKTTFDRETLKAVKDAAVRLKTPISGGGGGGSHSSGGRGGSGSPTKRARPPSSRGSAKGPVVGDGLEEAGLGQQCSSTKKKQHQDEEANEEDDELPALVRDSAADKDAELTMPGDGQVAAADRPFGKRTISTP